ncbi:MAG: phosphoglucosamine mutase [Pseudomonadales bacterium]|jgi:phosphoglucosamine mutase|nr:phosphoglucosamine mutase [Pseudomonadales bacterium]
MGERRWFGTDGIRGRVGDDPITPEFVLRLGWAAGRVFAREGVSRMLIGKDTRISGYMLESCLEAGLSAAGMSVQLTGPMPTPGVAYLTRTFRADAGIVISASHNPYQDNGIKFFSPAGDKLDDAIEDAIEAQLACPMTTVASHRLGKATRVEDAAGRYIEFCKATVGPGFRIPGTRIVLDCAHGATYHVAPAVFRELGARVVVTGAEPDGTNINDGCGATHPAALAARVREEGAELGIAFDGDGDRVIMVDHTGAVVDGDEILWIIAEHRHRTGRLRGGVVGTLMTNLGLELALSERRIPFARARVGDRYVLAECAQRGWQLGGEGSGHVLCLDVHTTGDGIVSALQVLAALAERDCSLADARRGMERCPQVLENVRVDDPRRVDGHPDVADAVRLVERALGEGGRVLIRPSGTEPLVRVMVEGRDADGIARHARSLAEVVGRSLGAA